MSVKREFPPTLDDGLETPEAKRQHSVAGSDPYSDPDVDGDRTFDGLGDWPSLHLSFPLPPLPDIATTSGESAVTETLSDIVLDQGNSLSPVPSPGTGLAIQIGPFQSVAPRNDAQRVWVGRSSTDPSVLTITQGKKFKITISLLNNTLNRTYQLYCAIRSSRDTSLKIAGKQLRSGKIADCDRIETERTYDISFEHSTYLQSPLRLVFFILEPSVMLFSDASLEKLESLDVPVFRCKAQTDEIEVITSTTWRNRYKPEGTPATVVPAPAAPVAPPPVSAPSANHLGSSQGGGRLLAPPHFHSHPASPSLPHSPAVLASNAHLGRSYWKDDWSNPASWRVVIQHLQNLFTTGHELDWLKFCIGSKVASAIDHQSSIAREDFDTIFHNLWQRIGPVDGPLLDRLYEQLFSCGWFCGFETDPFITSFLAEKPIGSFLVRFSSSAGSDPSAYTLAAKTSNAPVSYFKTRIAIDPKTRCYKIPDDPVTSEHFSSLRDLIEYHMTHPIYRAASGSPGYTIAVPRLVFTSLGGAPLEYGMASFD